MRTINPNFNYNLPDIMMEQRHPVHVVVSWDQDVAQLIPAPATIMVPDLSANPHTESVQFDPLHTLSVTLKASPQERRNHLLAEVTRRWASAYNLIFAPVPENEKPIELLSPAQRRVLAEADALRRVFGNDIDVALIESGFAVLMALGTTLHPGCSVTWGNETWTLFQWHYVPGYHTPSPISCFTAFRESAETEYLTWTNIPIRCILDQEPTVVTRELLERLGQFRVLDRQRPYLNLPPGKFGRYDLGRNDQHTTW
jgi:hypothetical protein